MSDSEHVIGRLWLHVLPALGFLGFWSIGDFLGLSQAAGIGLGVVGVSLTSFATFHRDTYNTDS